MGKSLRTYLDQLKKERPNELKVINSRGVWLQPDNILPTLEWFEAAKISGPQNNWIGSNVTGYKNPEFERRYGE